MNNNSLLIVYVLFKVMRIAFNYASLLIAKNFTAQIYMEKVLVNGENPPKLINIIYVSMLFEFVMVSIFLALLYAVDSQFELKLVNSSMNTFVEYLIPEYMISTLITFVYGWIISNKMYEKKYFLYKDDGLRAIRALSEIMFNISLVNMFIPWSFGTAGVKSLYQNATIKVFK
ncbi:hypothetical protein QKU58_gp076 [Pyramimonas orientalis virus]|uniref:Uncharacterized protein n=1 Tax=Pyramimonas orientalis virus 01B TaxID=3134525 RepID=A0A7M3UNJ4_9VIRU|nr:hypothetical protein QKU58_gp076 [Pyramimonas orientalis virus]QOI90255.1 hypothetical protein HWQ62_00118 [Pyramimonas orientalis virus]